MDGDQMMIFFYIFFNFAFDVASDFSVNSCGEKLV